MGVLTWWKVVSRGLHWRESRAVLRLWASLRFWFCPHFCLQFCCVLLGMLIISSCPQVQWALFMWTPRIPSPLHVLRDASWAETLGLLLEDGQTSRGWSKRLCGECYSVMKWASVRICLDTKQDDVTVWAQALPFAMMKGLTELWDEVKRVK